MSGTRELTYRELLERSLRIAGFFDEEPRTGHVVLLLSDPLEMVTAILGTLMAGRTYVPLDPAYPEARLRRMIVDAEPDVVISDIGDALRAAPMAARDVVSSPDAIASLLYTSGSTAGPKGVLQNHRNILFHVRNLTELFQISPSDRHSVVSSFSFDASTTDLFCALLNGAALVLIDLRGDGLTRLRRELAAHQVTLYHSTPTVFRHLQLDRETAPLPDLRMILLGGEPVTRQDVVAARALTSDDCLFVNGYGATETGGFIALKVVRATDPLPHPVIGIGEALPGMELALQNDELLMFSDHLGVGYWRDPERTAATFGRDRGCNVYRTGDLAERCPDGFRLTARRDRQTKVYGIRIDQAEVEDALRALPGVSQAAVSTRSGELLAHVRASVPLPDLRARLAETLPPAMIPKHWVSVEELPLTPTGKVDQARLGTTLDLVAAEWCAALGIPDVGHDVNFFDAGGHSLLLAEVHNRLEQRLNTTIPLYSLFENPTVRAMAARLDGRPPEPTAGDRTRNRIAARRRAGPPPNRHLRRDRPRPPY